MKTDAPINELPTAFQLVDSRVVLIGFMSSVWGINLI